MRDIVECLFHGNSCWLDQADASLVIDRCWNDGDLRKIDIKEVEEQLSQMVKDVEKALDSEEFKNMIAIWRQFHHYSVHNMLMVLTQKRTATRVAGFRNWKKLGRYVKKGEKGIMILCPRWAKRKVVEEDPDTGEETEVEQEHIYFVPGYVFDVTQTEGKDLPEVETLPQGQDVAEYYPMLREYAEKKLNLGVREAPIPGMGYTTKGEIVINSKYRGLEKVAVIVHEIAHQLFEHLIKYTDKTRKMKELEAESTVYVVNNILGIPTMGSTFYIAAWTKTPREIMGSLNRMHTVVQEILDIMAKPEGEQFPACPQGGEVSAKWWGKMRYELSQNDKMEISKIKGELRKIERMLVEVDDRDVSTTLLNLLAVMLELTKVTPVHIVVERENGDNVLKEVQVLEPIPPGKSPVSGTISAGYISEKVQKLQRDFRVLSKYNYIMGDVDWEESNAKKVKFTPEEEKAWEYAFAFYVNEGLSPEEADESAWKDIQEQFPRLKEYTGALPRTDEDLIDLNKVIDFLDMKQRESAVKAALELEKPDMAEEAESLEKDADCWDMVRKVLSEKDSDDILTELRS